ncbi:MAG: fatty acyl-AMP ligase [Caulobacteraceae bacterium]
MRSPDAEAFLWLENGEREGARITFAGLDRRARAIAALVMDQGLAGKPVLLAYPSGLDLVAALFGCFYAGAVAVVAPPPGAQSLDRPRLLVVESAAAAVLTVASRVEKAREETPAGTRVLATDGLGESGDLAPPPEVDPHSLAMLQYTSGSTAAPRGVMLTHANLLANLRAQARATRIEAGETAVSWLPFHHDMGLFGFGFFPIYAGLRSILMPPVAFLKRPARWLEVISRYGGALSAGPCFAYDLCARRSTAEQRAALDLSSWRVAVCGGEMIRPEVLERFAETFAPARFRRSALAPAYGLAEATLLAASVEAEQGFTVRAVDGPTLAEGRASPPVNPDRARRLVACGRPWPGHEAIVVDPVRRTSAPDGEVGEIWLRSASVSQGYWNRPDESAEIFGARLEGGEPSGGWLRTGDLGFLCDDGLVVTGRRKDMIIVRGANFDPLDLELAAEASHPALGAGGAAAFSFDDAAGEKVVLACEVERAAMKSLDADAVVASVAQAMSLDFGLTLHDLVLLKAGALPRTTSGKVQRHVCRARYLAGNLPGLAEGRHPELGRWRAARP